MMTVASVTDDNGRESNVKATEKGDPLRKRDEHEQRATHLPSLVLTSPLAQTAAPPARCARWRNQHEHYQQHGRVRVRA